MHGRRSMSAGWTSAAPPPSAVLLHRISWHLDRPLVTAAGAITEREGIIVEYRSSGVVGWGECAPLIGHTMDSIAAAAAALAVTAEAAVAGEPPPPLQGAAAAGWFGAVAGAAAQHAGQPLWRMLGGTQPRVLGSAALSLAADPDELATEARAAAVAGYRAVKLKIAPGADRDHITSVRARSPHLIVGVDANGAYSPTEIDAVAGLDDLGLAFVEQPFPPGPQGATKLDRDLQQRMETPICLDESAARREWWQQAIDSVRMVNLKPGRMAPQQALALHDAARRARVTVRIGGLVETDVGRRVAMALASLPGCRGPHDLVSPTAYRSRPLLENATALRDGGFDLPRAARDDIPEMDRHALDSITIERTEYC